MFFPRLLPTARALLRAATSVLLVAGYAHALNPGVALEDYNRASWSAREGAPADISAMAQTPDGWLWLSTSTGLYRFDGVQFERYALEAPGLNMRNRVFELVARPNGDLWITDLVGNIVRRLPDGRLENHTPPGRPIGPPGALAFDADGTIWLAARTGLYRQRGGQWQRLGAEQGWPAAGAVTLLLDQEQRLWVAGEDQVFRYNRRSQRFEALGIPFQHGSLTQSPDGRVWLVRRTQLELLPGSEAHPARPRPASFNQNESRWAQFDRDGNLWSLHCPRGLCRTTPERQQGRSVLIPERDASDRLDQRWQLSSLTPTVVLEDREGSIWVANAAGLDRLRENRLVPAHIPDPRGEYSMARDTEGRVWAADQLARTAWQLTPGAAPQRDPLQPVLVVANDRDGALLLAGTRHIERRYHGQSSRIALPPAHDGKLVDIDVLGLIDDGKVLWMASPQTGLMGWADGRWWPRSHWPLPERIFLSTAAGPGQQWMACNGDSMVFYDNGKQTRYADAGIGIPSVIHVGQEVVIGGDKGLAFFDGQQFRRLTASDPLVLVNVTGLAVTPDGDRWLNGSKGVLRVRRADWLHALAQPQHALVYQLYNALDGYQAQAMLATRHPSAFLAPDGQLWFMTTGDILRHDPRQHSSNPVPPSVAILRVNSAAGTLAAMPSVQLPPALPGFNIQFTAPSLRKPENVRFSYQLEGVDTDWQQAGTRRAAYYTNVAPGSYRFRVRAVNDDGVPSQSEASMQLEIAPTFTQTWWFKAVCLLSGMVLLYLLYRYRLHVATERLSERLQVRTAERERIARTLHDNFLQSVQAIILRLDTVSRELPPDSTARQRLESVLDSANDAVTEGRDHVYELRAGPLNDVLPAIRAAGAALADSYPGIEFNLASGGTPQLLADAVADEVCEIAREAMRNAFHHAQASRVEVRLGYGTDMFSLHVIDNGRGIASHNGDSGDSPPPLKHWGLVGMRERAARAGGRLDIDSKAGLGTSVALMLPGRQAYARPHQRTWRDWLR